MHDTAGDERFPSSELDFSRRFQRTCYRQTGEFGDRHAVDLDREAFRTQPLAMAKWAVRGGHVVEKEIAIAVGGRLLEGTLEKSKNAYESSLAALSRLAV